MLLVRLASGSEPGSVITLRAEAAIAGPTVQLGDIADVTAADAALGRRLSEVDLTSADEPALPMRLGRRFIDLRLQLAGFTADDYALLGADAVSLRSDEASHGTAVDFERAAESTLAQLWRIPAADVQARLESPVSSPAMDVGDRGTLRMELRAGGSVTPGQVTLHCRRFSGSRLLGTEPLTFTVSRRSTVLICTADAVAGEILTAEMLQSEHRWLTETVDGLAPSQAIGRALTRPVAAGDLLSAADLRVARPTAAPAVIQPRDPVRVVARRGALTVVLHQAEALQSGRVGQCVRVRNPESQRIISARVVAAGEVEIAL